MQINKQTNSDAINFNYFCTFAASPYHAAVQH